MFCWYRIIDYGNVLFQNILGILFFYEIVNPSKITNNQYFILYSNTFRIIFLINFLILCKLNNIEYNTEKRTLTSYIYFSNPYIYFISIQIEVQNFLGEHILLLVLLDAIVLLHVLL